MGPYVNYGREHVKAPKHVINKLIFLTLKAAGLEPAP